jgi:methionine-rich copper-binding protein CopC
MRKLPTSILASTLVLLLAALFSGGGQRAFAHAGYESSTPADGEVLAESPAQIEVIFGQEVARSGGLPSLTVTNPAGDLVADEAIVDDADRTRVTIDLPPALGAGRYTVIWHTLSDEDGEEAQGAFHFFVDPNATSGSQTATGTPTPTGTAVTVQPAGNTGGGDGGLPIWALIGGIAVALVVGTSAGVTLGSRRPT